MNANSGNDDIENLLFIMANLPDFLKISVCRKISPSELTKLLHSYLLILDEVKLFDKLDGKLILAIFTSLEESERMKLLICLKEAVFLNPNGKEILKKIPADLVKAIIN